jgi:DNA-binding response OmpR family regulator
MTLAVAIAASAAPPSRRRQSAVCIDSSSGRVYQGDCYVQLTRLEFELFVLLLKRRGRLVTWRRLYNQLYQLRAEGECPTSNGLKVFSMHLRRKLAPLGYSIKTVWGQGLQFVETT